MEDKTKTIRIKLLQPTLCRGKYADPLTKPCWEWGGDCDTDDDCVGSLVCGHNNCHYTFRWVSNQSDCCVNP